MNKKDPSNTGGRVLLKKLGKQYFRNLAKKRWEKVKHEKKLPVVAHV